MNMERDQRYSHTMNEKSRQPGSDPKALFRVAEHFLRRRHFNDCRKYAQQAFQIDPNFPGIPGIIAVADVLLAAEPRISAVNVPDWYRVLQLDRYSQDADLIRQRFNNLYAVLNPSSNNFPFTKEAFDLVCDAWYVLTNPLKKLEFDDALKKHLGDENSKEKRDFTFWTVCPYCYHLYEYPRVYLEFCLWCPNEKCSKAFTCVEIDRPPVEVLMEGKYKCAGFLPLEFQGGNWNPFAPLPKQKGDPSDDACKFVEISDDDDEDEVDTKSDKAFNVAEEIRVHDGDEGVNTETGMPVSEVGSTRKKKSIAKNTMKMTGTGNRVTKEGFVHQMGDETVLNGDDNDFDFGFLDAAMDTDNGGEVEVYDADDDILVGLHNGT